MKEKQTCGPLYKAGLESFTGMDAEKIPLFAAGFVSGQAEKIYLGACQAAMFRPSADYHKMVALIVVEVAGRYDLRVATLRTSRGLEIWLCRSIFVVRSIGMIGGFGENSTLWHERRGTLCGVPASEIDNEFHKRHGYGESCDSAEGTKPCDR